MSSPPPHLVYACWASADEWQLGFVMLGANVHSIPAPPPLSEPIIGVDGFWGAHEWTVYPQPYRHEFPYLAWIPLCQRSLSVPSDVLTRPVEKTMWRIYPHRSDCHFVDPGLLEELIAKWKSIKAALEGPFSGISQNSFSSVEKPMRAYARAFEALDRLNKDFRAWRDFVEVFRNLQRSLLELCAFLDWWKDVCTGSSFRPPVRPPTRGAIFREVQLYADHARWSVASYLLIHKSTFALDSAKEVALSHRNLCSAQPMLLRPLVHSLHHWYYPPLVNNVVVDLETAARGYLERLDNFRPTKKLKRTLDKSENKKNDEGKRMFYSPSTILTSYVQLAAGPKRRGWTRPPILRNHITQSSDALTLLGQRLLGSRKYKRSGRLPWAMSATSNSLPRPHLDGSSSLPFTSFGVVMKKTSVRSTIIFSSSAAKSGNGPCATSRPSLQVNGGLS